MRAAHHHCETERRRPAGLACRRARPHSWDAAEPTVRAIALELACRYRRAQGSRLITARRRPKPIAVSPWPTPDGYGRVAAPRATASAPRPVLSRRGRSRSVSEMDTCSGSTFVITASISHCGALPPNMVVSGSNRTSEGVSRRGAPALVSPLRIQRVIQRVADQVQAQSGEKQGAPRKGRHPPSAVEEFLRVVQHRPPAHDVGIAEAEKGEAGL